MAWSQDQVRNAQIIVSVGRKLGASDRDIQIALMVALTESGLHNVHYGDRDSLGLFQQRAAWGSVSERLDPAKSARMFFLGGHEGQRGLFDFSNRNHMTMGQAAQAVQVSAYPDRYAEHATEAQGLLYNFGGTPTGGGKTVKTPGIKLGDIPDINAMAKPQDLRQRNPLVPTSPDVTQVNDLGEVTADASGLGEQGGTTALASPLDAVGSDTLDALTFDNAGPTVDPMSELHAPTLEQFGLDQHVSTSTKVTGADGNPIDLPTGGAGMGGLSAGRKAVVAFAHKMLGVPYVWGGTSLSGVDCSGLVLLALKRAGVSMPRISADQARRGTRVPISKLKPGDLVAWDNSSRNNGADHIAIYIGHGMIIEAPRPGEHVQLSHIYDTGEAWGVHLNY